MYDNSQLNVTDVPRSLSSLSYYTLIVANYANNQMSTSRNILNNFDIGNNH